MSSAGDPRLSRHGGEAELGLTKQLIDVEPLRQAVRGCVAMAASVQCVPCATVCSGQ